MPNNPTNKITSEELERFDKGDRTIFKAAILENPNSNLSYQLAQEAYNDLIKAKSRRSYPGRSYPGGAIKRRKKIKELESLLKKYCMPHLDEWGAKILFDAKIDISTNAETKPLPSDRQENYFRLNGDYWEVGYKGKETKLKNLERLRYIIHLLDNPGVEIYSHDLIQRVKKNSPDINENYSKMSQEQLEAAEGLSLVDINIPDLSKEDKDKIEEQAYKAWGKYKKYGNKHNAENEWDNLKRYLRSGYGIGVHESPKGLSFYHRKRLNDDAEKTRQNVTKQISAAIKDIEKILPSLAKYLKTHISTGAACIYRPDRENKIDWDIHW